MLFQWLHPSTTPIHNHCPVHICTCIQTDVFISQLLWVFEHLAAITSQPAETPNERNFQAQYGETINSALQRLRSPLNYATPHSVWEPFKEVRWKCACNCTHILSGLSIQVSPGLCGLHSNAIGFKSVMVPKYIYFTHRLLPPLHQLHNEDM